MRHNPSRPYRQRRARPMSSSRKNGLLALAGGLILCAMAGAALTAQIAVALDAANPPLCKLIVETDDGNVYVAGVGDDCRAAARHAVMPAGRISASYFELDN